MDPILVRAIRSLLKAQRLLKARGEEPLGDDEREAFLREETGGKYGLKDMSGLDRIGARNVARSMFQGATMNWGDELVGLVSPDAQEEMRLRDELFREAHPVASGAAEVAGGLATALVPGAMAARAGAGAAGGLSAGSAVLRGAATGAGMGAVAGAGTGEGWDVADRLDRAVIPAAAGGLFGGAIPGAVAVGRTMFSPAARASRRLAEAVSREGEDAAALAARSGASGAPVSPRDVLERRLADFETAGRGDQVMLADLGPHLRAQADFAATNDVATHTRLARATGERQANMARRLRGDVEELAGGGAPIDAPRRLDAMRRRLRSWAASDRGYEGLRRRYPTIDDPGSVLRLKQVFSQPKLRDAWAEARQTGLIGRDLDIANPSFQIVQDVKESLDDAITSAFRQGKGNLATRLKDAREMVLSEMGRIPGYRAVAEEYGRRSRLVDALQHGMEAFHAEADARQLRAIVRRMSPEEQAQFRFGLANELVVKLRKPGSEQANIAARMVAGGDDMADRLRAVFGNEATFQRYADRARAELEMHHLRAATGNSATAMRTQEAGRDPLEGLTPASLANPTDAISAGLLARAKGAIARRTARELGPTLMTRGGANIRAVLDGPRAAGVRVGPLSSGYLPSLSGGLFATALDRVNR